MKLLLTSAGLTNPSITHALENLLGHPLKGTATAFIPTAANIEDGDKTWMIEDLSRQVQAELRVDIVDISALSKELWLPRLQAAEILFLGGGNTFHLMYWIKKSGLQDELPNLLKDKVYIGLSAGSCVAGPTIDNSVQHLVGDQYHLKIEKGLGIVSFHFVPHLNSPYFENITAENVKKASQNLKVPVYALDDNSALTFVDGVIEIVSEGEYVVCGGRV